MRSAHQQQSCLGCEPCGSRSRSLFLRRNAENNIVARFGLSVWTPDIHPVGYNVIEFNRNDWRDIIVWIRIIRITRAGSSHGKKKHQAENSSPNDPKCQHTHIRTQIFGVAWDSNTYRVKFQINTLILADT